MNPHPAPAFPHLRFAEAVVEGLSKLAPGAALAVVLTHEGPKRIVPSKLALSLRKASLVGVYRLPVSALAIAADIDETEAGR